jgi:hypothetical protein
VHQRLVLCIVAKSFSRLWHIMKDCTFEETGSKQRLLAGTKYNLLCECSECTHCSDGTSPLCRRKANRPIAIKPHYVTALPSAFFVFLQTTFCASAAAYHFGALRELLWQQRRGKKTLFHRFNTNVDIGRWNVRALKCFCQPVPIYNAYASIMTRQPAITPLTRAARAARRATI